MGRPSVGTADTESLKDLFTAWGLPEKLCNGTAPCWRCVRAARCASETECWEPVMRGSPTFPPPHLSDRLRQVIGQDALEFVTRPEWNAFPRPRFAMLGGWGAPGSDLHGAEHATLVSSFQDVLASPEAVNLQMFHRDAAASPSLPRLPELLDWPLPELFATEAGSAGVPCDMATRVSRRGAITWWHLDDCGEFVLQVAAPLSEQRLQQPVLLGPSGLPVVKVFVFFPPHTYDLVTQDEVMNSTGKFAHLDLFNTPEEHLPVPALPTLHVAALEAGGRPLLSPPNWPHLVVTLQDCVMVEERRVSRLFLDESLAFARRAAVWREAPISYPPVQRLLQTPEGAAEAIQWLRSMLGSLGRSTGEKGEGGLVGGDALGGTDCMKAGLRERAEASLKALQLHCAHMGLHSSEAPGEAPHASTAPEKSGHGCTGQSIREQMLRAWDSCLNGRSKGVTKFPALGVTDATQFAAHIHSYGRARWGPLRCSKAEAMADRKRLVQAKKCDKLEAEFTKLTAGL